MSTETAAREAVAKWMIERGYATGHGDTIDDLLAELVAQVRPVSKRPVAFRAPKKDGGWVVTRDEQEAADVADAISADYQGLYVRDGSLSGDRTNTATARLSPESNPESFQTLIFTDQPEGGKVE